MIAPIVWNAAFLRLNAFQRWKSWDTFAESPIPQQKMALSQGLLDTLRYFGARDDGFPEWRELASNSSPDDVWKNWESLPIVTKKDIRERFDPEEIQAKYGIDGAVNASGGSTGTPTRFIWDRAAATQQSSLQYYCWRKFGWTPQLPVLCIWGSPRDIGQSEKPRTRALLKLRNTTVIDGFEFSQATLDAAIKTLESHNRLAIYGYTSLLEQLAREILRCEYPVRSGHVVTAWSGAEPLHDSQSDLFKEAFGVPIHNHYGGREFGAIAYKLAGTPSFRIFRPVMFLEIVNDRNELCAPGETGRVLLTTLIGRGTPFIRYENGDLARYSEHDLTEAGLVGMSTVEGRTGSFTRLPDGRIIHSVFWYQLFKDYKEIESFHVHQDERGEIDITYVGVPLSTDTARALNHLISSMLGDTCFTISRVETLPKTSQGKHLHVTSDFAGEASW